MTTGPTWGVGSSSDFRSRSTLGVAVAALVLLAPFALNNFIQGRFLLGAWSSAIVVILAANAWALSHGRYHPWLILLGLVPAGALFLVVSLRQQGVIGALWCYPAVLSFYAMLPERKAWIANVAILMAVLPETWSALAAPLAARVAATLLSVSLFTAIFVRVITAQQERLEALAVTDPLTGLANRTLLDRALEEAIQQSRRTGVPMTLVTLDLDHFKAVNDTHGHEAGDAVLRDLGELLQRRVRRVDRVFRLGGEEFLALLYATDLENGRRVAEELRRAIAAAPLLPGQPVTVSAGVATLQDDENWMDWMKRSDENLYRAKAGGRNLVVA